MTRSIASLGLAALILSGCSHLSSVRVQPDAVDVGPNKRPIAAIQANAISAYILFIPLPGVDLDQVINQMLIVAAKTMGADKVAQLQFEVTPDGGVWALHKLLGLRSARASGIAVQITAPAPDPAADDGPEPSSEPAEPPADDPAPPNG
jgi:hypothetical protein